jgi:hypothetical protein
LGRVESHSDEILSMTEQLPCKCNNKVCRVTALLLLHFTCHL